MSYKWGWFKNCLPSAKQIYRQFCSLLLPFQGNYFWLFTIMHVVAGALETCYSFKKKNKMWEAASLPDSFHYETSGSSPTTEPQPPRASCLQGTPQCCPTRWLLIDWNKRSHTWPWAYHAHENPKRIFGKRIRTWGSGAAMVHKPVHKRIPDGTLDEFTQSRQGSECRVCRGLMSIQDFSETLLLFYFKNFAYFTFYSIIHV